MFEGSDTLSKSHAVRPERCPCCGAGLMEDRNSRGKYRLFRYECGASGWHDERMSYDHDLLCDQPLWIGELNWEHACPDAMLRFIVQPVEIKAKYAT